VGDNTLCDTRRLRAGAEGEGMRAFVFGHARLIVNTIGHDDAHRRRNQRQGTDMQRRRLVAGAAGLEQRGVGAVFTAGLVMGAGFAAA